MKWQSGYLRRVVATPIAVALDVEHADAAMPLHMLLDACICCAGIWGGASVLGSQAAAFLVMALLNYRLRVRPSAEAGAGFGPWTLCASAAGASLLIVFLRCGLLELLLRSWALPTYTAVTLTVIGTGIFMQIGNGICLAQPGRSVDTGPRRRALVMGVVGYVFLLRLVYSAQVELLPEEAYYWNYSRHLDIGYLDHPPLVAWLIRAGTFLFGNTEFGVRVGALCCGIVAAIFLFRLTRDLFGEASALFVLVLAQALPFFFLSGMLMTPDAPLTAAWAASLYFFARALLAGQPRAWLWAGVSLGVGLLSKYTIGLVAIAALLFVVSDPPSRRWLRRREPYVAVLVAVLVFAPVIIWNARHDWASFVFQTSRRLAERPRFALPVLIGAAMVLITPTGLLTIAAAFVRGRRRLATAGSIAIDPAWRFIQWFLFVPLTVFVLFSLRHEIKLDWTGAPWAAALPLMAFAVLESRSRRAVSRRWLLAWRLTVLVVLSIYGAGLYYLVAGIPGVGYSSHTELLPVEWRDFGRQIDAIAADMRTTYGDDSLIVGMDRYAIASELAFYSADQSRAIAGTTSGHLFNNMGLMYEQWFPARSQAGRTLLLVAWDRDELAAPRLENFVDGLEPVREGILIRNAHGVRPYYFRIAHGYHSR